MSEEMRGDDPTTTRKYMWNPPRDARLREEWVSDTPVKQIALILSEMHGMVISDPTSVLRRAAKLRLPKRPHMVKRPPGLTAEQAAIGEWHILRGCSADEIAFVLGCDFDAADVWRNTYLLARPER